MQCCSWAKSNFMPVQASSTGSSLPVPSKRRSFSVKLRSKPCPPASWMRRKIPNVISRSNPCGSYSSSRRTPCVRRTTRSNAKDVEMGSSSSRRPRCSTAMLARTLRSGVRDYTRPNHFEPRSWNHFTNDELKNNHDDLLRAETGQPEISFVFQYISH